METKEFTKWPKRKLVQLSVNRNLTTWEDGNKMGREQLLKLLKDA